MGWILLLCLAISAAASRSDGRERRKRAEAEYWSRRLVDGDGINLRWAHHVNSWPELFHQIQDEVGNKSDIIEGDVFLRRDGVKGAEPMMLLPPNSVHALTFRQWITRVSAARKAIRINLLSTEAVRPAMQYVFANKASLHFPVLLHADILPGPGSVSEPVSAKLLVQETALVAQNTTLSVGWTQTPDEAFKELSTKELRYTWRDVLDMVGAIYDAPQQSLLFTVTAELVCDSLEQLLWLLGVRPSWRLLIQSPRRRDGSEAPPRDWQALIGLRENLPAHRLLYDLTPSLSAVLNRSYPGMPYSVYVERGHWRPAAWRVVQFINPRRLLSTIVISQRGPAFLGWPTAFLLSEKPRREAVREQRISGRVLFVPKPNYGSVNRQEQTGLSIFLLNSLDVGSPRLLRQAGVQVFIGFDGQIRIQATRAPNVSSWRRRRQRSRQTSQRRAFLPSALSQMVRHDCYSFVVIDGPAEVALSIWAAHCDGSPDPPPRRSWHRRLSLPVPRSPTQRQRHVLLQKTGDGTVDLLLQDLSHSAAGTSAIPLLSRLLLFPLLASLLSDRLLQ